MSSNFYRLATTYSKDISRSPDLYELLNVAHIPGRTGPIATIRLVTGKETKEISTDYLMNVPDKEVSEYLLQLHTKLLEQIRHVAKTMRNHDNANP